MSLRDRKQMRSINQDQYCYLLIMLGFEFQIQNFIKIKVLVACLEICSIIYMHSLQAEREREKKKRDMERDRERWEPLNF